MSDESGKVVKDTTALPRRRWFRFTLRTMLFVITLATIPLGIWINRAQRQRHAVAELFRAQTYKDEWGNQLAHIAIIYEGATNGYQYEPGKTVVKSSVPDWILEQTGIDMFHNVEYLSCDLSRLDVFADPATQPNADEFVGYLRDLPHLKNFTCDMAARKAGRDKNDFFKIVGQMSELEQLWLHYSGRLSKDEIAHLAKHKNLKYFMLEGRIESDEDLENLTPLIRVHHLTLRVEKPITAAGLKHLAPLQRITGMRIDNKFAVDHSHIEVIASQFPELENLAIAMVADPKMFESFKQSQSLKSLEVMFRNKDSSESHMEYGKQLKAILPKVKIEIVDFDGALFKRTPIP